MPIPSTMPQMSDVSRNDILGVAQDNKTGALSTMPGFLTQKVGRKIVITYTDASKAEVDKIDYYDGATLLFTIEASSTSTTETYERTV